MFKFRPIVTSWWKILCCETVKHFWFIIQSPFLSSQWWAWTLKAFPVHAIKIANGYLCVYAVRFWVKNSSNSRNFPSGGVTVAYLWVSLGLVQKSNAVFHGACTFGSSQQRGLHQCRDIACPEVKVASVNACLAFSPPQSCQYRCCMFKNWTQNMACFNF